MAEGGVAAVAVEPVARRLGATKGSFYWHFKDRAALVEAALRLYEEEGTEAVIADVLAGPADPRDRLDLLFSFVFERSATDRIHDALMAAAADPLVAPVLARITERRLGALSTMMTELGHPPSQAHHLAVLAYSTWLGLAQADRASGGALFASKDARARYLQFLRPVIQELATGAEYRRHPRPTGRRA
jgi:AcrR family transcriptional regulator